MSLALKKCPKCKIEKQETEYSKSQYRVNAYCKPCMTEYYKERTKKINKRKQGGWFV